MKPGTLNLSFDFLQKHKRNVITCLVIALASYVFAGLIVQEDANSFIYVLGGVLGIVGVIVILQNWRRGVYFFIAWILLEDLLRKYLGNNMVIYFAKDFIVLVLYVAFLRASKSTGAKLFKPPFRIVLLVFFWYCLVQAFNPLSTSIFFGLMGLKLYFYYAPLLFFGYELVDSERELRRFFFFNSVLILVVVGFGIAQAILGHTFLNPAVVQQDIRELSNTYRTSPISGLVAYRPTSFFVSVGRFQNFVIASWILALGFGGFLLRRKQSGRWLGFLTIGVTAAAAMMTASRGVFLWTLFSAIVIGAAFVWDASLDSERQVRVLRTIIRTAIFVALGVAILVSIFPEEVASRLAIYSETLSPYSSASELGYRAREYPFQAFIDSFNFPHWLYGYGIGTASLGGQYVTRLMRVPPMNIGVENGYGQIILELGIPGLLLWILLAFAITRSAWRVVKGLKGTPWFAIGFAIFWYVWLMVFPMSFYGMTIYQDFVMNAYFWLALGILFRLATFPRNNSEAGQTQ